MKVIVLCAGYATRLYPLTLNTPKALLKVGNTSILDLLMNELQTLPNVNEVNIVTNSKFYSNFEDWNNKNNYNLTIKVIDDGTKTNETRLGAIGDIQFCIEKQNIDDDVMVLVSDNYFTFKLSDFYNYYKQKDSDVVLAAKFDDLEYLSKHFGVAVVGDDDLMLDMVEKPGRIISDTGLYGLYILKKNSVRRIRDYLDEGNSHDALGNFISWLHKKSPVYCYKFKGECYDIGTREMYDTLNERFKNN